MKKTIKWDKIDLGILLFFTAVFGFIFFAFPAMKVNDTFQHENHFITREPVYALIIQGLKVFWGENYLKPLVLIQNILAIIANTLFVRFIKNTFKLNVILSGMVAGIVLVPHILTPLCSKKHLIITNAIMTEGIAMSVFLIFAMVLMSAMWKKENAIKECIYAALLALLVSFIRGQMMTMILIWAVVCGCKVLIWAFEQKQFMKKAFFIRLCGIAIIVICSFLVRTYGCRIYNYLEWGIYADTASGKAMSVANVIYVAEREDGVGIEDEGVRQLFYNVYDDLVEHQLTADFAPAGLLGRAGHHEDNHEIVNFDYFTDQAKDYVRDTTGIYVEQYMQLMVEVDKVASTMMKGLLPQCIDRYAYNYLAIVIYGFIRSVAIVHPILNWYALVFYIVVISLAAFLYKKDRHSKAASLVGLGLLMVCANVFATSLIIQCISRYMFYTFPIIYTAALMLLVELFRIYNKKKR